MKTWKKAAAAVLCALLVICMVPTGIGTQTGLIRTVEAASKITLNVSRKTMAVGQTARLKVKGTKKKVRWKSSKPSVVAVTSTGKLRAKKRGTALITARIGKIKRTCKVTVRTNKQQFEQETLQTTGMITDVDGNLIPTIRYGLKEMQYTSGGDLKIKIHLENYQGEHNWQINHLYGFLLSAADGTPLVKLKSLPLNKTVALEYGYMCDVTITIPGKRVKKVIDLNEEYYIDMLFEIK